MTFSEIIVKAIEKRDASTIAKIAAHLRFGPVQYTYKESYAFICRACRKRGVEPPELPEWDDLLGEADDYDARG